MATYTLNIIPGAGGSPIANQITCDDGTVIWPPFGMPYEVANNIQFNNTTGQTVYLTGGTNWDTFFSQNSIIINEGMSPVYTFNLVENGSWPESVYFTLTNDNSPRGMDSPTFIITMDA